MTVNYTTLLGLGQPVTGTEQGSWGDVVNDEVTALLEDAVANAVSISVTAGDPPALTDTNGAANQARMSTLILTGSPGATRNIVAPSRAKIYQVINQSNGAVVIKGAATTGVTIAAGATGTVAWNGSDFIEIGSTSSGRTFNGNVTVNGVITAQAAATQDAVKLEGRAGGSSSYAVTITPTTLSGNRTITAPDTALTLAGIDVAQTFTAVQTFTPAARTSGAASYFTLTTPADTGQTASTEVIGANFTAATRTWLNGNITTQRERVFAAPTYAFFSSPNSTITTAINVDIATPAAGTNATITNAYALRAGDSLFTEAVTFSATTQNIALGTSQTSGTFAVGGTAATGAITLDASTKTHTLNVGSGATESGETKTINIGTGGVATSTTTITIGASNGTTTTVNGTLNATTLDLTTLEVTNIKAKDGTASATIADATGVMTIASSVLTTTDINGGTIDGATVGASTASTGAFTTLSASGAVTLSGGTANGVAYLNGSNVLTTGSALTFDGTTLTASASATASGNFKSTSSTAQVFNVTASNDAGTSIGLGVFGSGAGTFGTISAGTPFLSTSAASMVQNVQNASGAFVWGIGSTPAEQMRLTSTGLGIGTSSPSTKLDVAGAIRATSAGTVLGASVAALDSYEQLDLVRAGDAYLFMRNTNTGGVGNSGFIDFYSKSSNGTESRMCRIGGVAESLATSTVAGAVVFSTTNSSGTFAEQMRLTSTGLGIGTSSPARPLHVANVPAGTGMRVSGPSGDNNWAGGIEFYSNNATTVTSYITASTGGMMFGYGGSESARIDASGNLLVNKTTTSQSTAGTILYGGGSSNAAYFTGDGAQAIYINRETSDGTVIDIRRAAGTVGTISVTASATAYNTSSDYRLKENIQPMQGALATVAQLNPVTYNWIANGSAGQGFIAHELQAVVPDCVTGERDAVDAEGRPQYQGVDTSFLVATLTAAIKELKAEFDAYVATHP